MPNLTVDPQSNATVPEQPISVAKAPPNFTRAILLGIILFIILSITAYGAYWYGRSSAVKETSSPPTPINQKPRTLTSQTLGTTYRDDENFFEIQYPPEVVIRADPTKGFPLFYLQGFTPDSRDNFVPSIYFRVYPIDAQMMHRRTLFLG